MPNVRGASISVKHVVSALAIMSGLALLAAELPSTKNGEWFYWSGDLKGTRYSPLSQINADNFNKLEVAWRFKTDSFGTRPEYKLEGTPLMVNGVIYTTAGTRRDALLWTLSRARSFGSTACTKVTARRSRPDSFPATEFLLDRRPGRRANLVHHHWLSSGRVECQDRHSDSVVRKHRRSRSQDRPIHGDRQADRY